MMGMYDDDDDDMNRMMINSMMMHDDDDDWLYDYHLPSDTSDYRR